jgi:hypothetical protein
MGSVKDIQAHLRHAKADTTANEYMQELPESVKRMVGERDAHEGRGVAREFGAFATKSRKLIRATCCKYLKEMVGTRRLELLTSTVSIR